MNTQTQQHKNAFTQKLVKLLAGSIVCMSFSFVAPPASKAQEKAGTSPQEIHTLEIDAPVERQMSGGEMHTYRIHLNSNQYLHLLVEQKGIDVMVKVFAPDGGQLLEMDSPNGTKGPEPVSLVADTSGDFRIEVSALEKDAQPGNYEIKVVDLRKAREEDRLRIAAEKALAEAKKLQALQKADSYQDAIKKYKEALSFWQARHDTTRQAAILTSIGYVYYTIGNHPKALESFKETLPLWKTLGDSNRVAQALNNIGLVSYYLGNSDKALDYLTDALRLRKLQNDSSEIATALNNIGLVHSRSGKKDKALDYYFQSLSIIKISGNKKREASLLNNIGTIYSALGDKNKALEYHKQALSLRQNVDDRQGQAQSLNNIGATYKDLGEMKKALDYYKQALEMHRAVGHLFNYASTLNNIGAIYCSSGDKKQALHYYEQSLVLRRKAGDRVGEAQTLSNIGLVYSVFGEKQKALNHYYQALALHHTLDAPDERTSILINLGAAYNGLGEHEKALDHYERALKLYKVIGNKREEATALHNIGSVHKDLRNNKLALEYLHRALLLKRRVGDRHREAHTLGVIAIVHYNMAEDEKAIDYYNQALRILQSVGDRLTEAITIHNLGTVYHYGLKKFDKAFEYYQQALQLNSIIGDRSGDATIFYNIAQLELSRGNFSQARQRIEAALQIIESVRTKVVSHELRASYSAKKLEYYTFYIELLMQLHQGKQLPNQDVVAFETSERYRGRSLVENLSEVSVDIRRGVDSTLVQHEVTLREMINSKSDMLIRFRSDTGMENQVKNVQLELDSLLVEFQQIQDQIRTASPHYADLIQPRPLDAEQIQQQVLDDETMLLEYALGKDRSYLFAVTPDTLHVFTLPKRAEIDSVARKVYALLIERNRKVEGETRRKRNARVNSADAAFLQPAAALSQVILAPAADLLENKRLLIVADGALQYVPFGALPVPVSSIQYSEVSKKKELNTEHRSLNTEYRPLITEYEIVSLPSASVLAVLREQFANRKSAPKMVAMLADPVFSLNDVRAGQTRGGEIPTDTPADSTHAADALVFESTLDIARRQTTGDSTRAGFSRLVFSRREANAIMQLVPERSGLKALDYAANRETATSPDLSQYRIVHFATHGLLNSQHPELSGLVLSLLDSLGNAQDGFLRLHDIYNLDLEADLVVLSACETALGKEIRGEGLVGLVRGFMYAGAPRIVASLWQVNDESTAELMRWFYQKMLGEEKLRPAAALRAAQIEMWQIKRWRSPYFWAAFGLQGEWR